MLITVHICKTKGSSWHTFTFSSHPHADAHSTHGDDAGDLKRPAALAAHQAVPRPQAALGTTAARAPALRFPVTLRLRCPRVPVLLIPLLTLTFSHDASVCLSKRQIEYNGLRTDGFRSVKKKKKREECNIVPKSHYGWIFTGDNMSYIM